MYRSARFLPIIEANLDVILTMADVEVLVSDRHGLDDALGRLRTRYGGDARVRFFAATDGLDWVGHYNWLLAQGTGEYFAWMPHDDTFPSGYYPGLIEHLDARPDTLLAFGPMRAVDEQERQIPDKAWGQDPPPWNSPASWSYARAYRALTFKTWVAFRGVFRRQPIVDRQLWIRRIFGNQGSDVAWLFGVALLGALRFARVPACTKRYYPDSTHMTTMPFTLWSHTSHFLALFGYAWSYSPTFWRAVRGMVWLVRGYFRFLRAYATSPTLRWKPADGIQITRV